MFTTLSSNVLVLFYLISNMLSLYLLHFKGTFVHETLMADFQTPKERLEQLNASKEQMRLKLENLKRKATVMIKLAKQHSDIFPGSSSIVLTNLQSYATEVSSLVLGTHVL